MRAAVLKNWFDLELCDIPVPEIGNDDVLVKIAIDAYIPEDYIATSEERMVAYKRISSISSV